MYLQIGSRLRPFNEVKAPAIAYKPIYDAKRRMIAVEETWQISGRIVLQTNATQTNMTKAIDLLKRDLDTVRPDLRFLEDNGSTPSAFVLLRQDCIDGPNLIDASFPSDANDVYPTGVMWQAVFAAKRSLTNSNVILEFSETLSNPEGGRVIGMVGGSINFAEVQLFRANEPYRYIQSGRAVGLFGPPTPPPPLWPAFRVRPDISQPVMVSPRILYPVAQEFERSWTYEFVSNFPLIGTPHTFI